MLPASRDKPSDTGDVVLERTAGQTLWWFLGHPISVAVIAGLLVVAVIVASAIAAGSTPNPVTGPGTATEPATGTGPAEARLTIDCPAGANLTVTASGVGSLETAIDGPSSGYSSGPGTATVSLTGPPGTYHVRVTATVRLGRVSWSSTAGLCTE